MNEAQFLILGIPMKDWFTILAILAAPWIALWIQAKLDDRKEAKKRRLDIFKTLMATRATPLSQTHIKALNMIDIEFYENKKYRSVRKTWRAYLHVRIKHTVNNDAEMIQFNKDCEETLTNLLVAMGESLGYDFDETHIRESIYKPQSLVTEENYQAFIKSKLVELFSGKTPLPMDVKSFSAPLPDPSVAEEWQKLRTLAIQFLERKTSEN